MKDYEKLIKQELNYINIKLKRVADYDRHIKLLAQKEILEKLLK